MVIFHPELLEGIALTCLKTMSSLLCMTNQQTKRCLSDIFELNKISNVHSHENLKKKKPNDFYMAISREEEKKWRKKSP